MIIEKWIDKTYKEIILDKYFQECFANNDLIEDNDRYYLYNYKKGINIVFSKELNVMSIHLFSGITKEGDMYKGRIPFDLNFLMSQITVHAILGVPDKSGGGYSNIFGPIPYWEKFFLADYSLHVQYSNDKTMIQLVTLSSLSLETYLNVGLQ